MIATIAGQLLPLLSVALIGVALVLLIEGLIYALFAESVKRLLMQMVDIPTTTLRSGGLVAAASGLGLMWLLRQ
jgi:uncharacterized protein YjeT (DUF2065 family)